MAAADDYAMDAVLYMTTGMLDRHDEDIMLETAICKVFCSEMGWRVVNDGASRSWAARAMTENEVERVFEIRINLIVGGANEVMQSFIFAYGGKPSSPSMLTVKNAPRLEQGRGPGGNFGRILKNSLNFKLLRAAVPLGIEIFLGIRRGLPPVPRVRIAADTGRRLSWLIREHSHQFNARKRYEEAIITRRASRPALADNAMWLHAFACTLSKLDQDLRRGGDGAEFERDKAAVLREHLIWPTTFF